MRRATMARRGGVKQVFDYQVCQRLSALGTGNFSNGYRVGSRCFDRCQNVYLAVTPTLRGLP